MAFSSRDHELINKKRYIFLAIIMGPALIKSGLDPIASHLFILYWGMLSYITPPVALAAVAASIIAKSGMIETGMRSMRLGLINFIIPFIFVLDPTLILHGEVVDIIVRVSTAIVAVWLMASAFEGYLYHVGIINWSFRAPLLVAAAALLYGGLEGYLGGIVIIGIVYGVGRRRRKAASEAA